MSDERRPLRPATLKDLQDLLAHAMRHPAERQKLADAPEDALQQAGLLATPDAVDFLRSLGQTRFEEAGPATPVQKPDPLGGGAGEM